VLRDEFRCDGGFGHWEIFNLKKCCLASACR
jgi:hypothetical protein